MTETLEERAARMDLAERVVRHEYAQFQQVPSEGGPAECQSNWPVFHQMRLSQFMTWPRPLLESYQADLLAADAAGRNLLTEKYARMMASTEPERFASQIAPMLPVLSDERVAAQEAIVAIQVEWAADFHARFPRLGAGMRVLRTAQDTLQDTSLETYLRGELGSYSERTLGLYRELVDATQERGGNLTETTVLWTVVLAGYESLDAAEAAQVAVPGA